MVQYLQYPFGLGLLNAMIQGGETKEHQKAKSINTGPNDTRYIGIVGRQCRKDGDTDDTEENAKGVDEAMHHFLLECKTATDIFAAHVIKLRVDFVTSSFGYGLF